MSLSVLFLVMFLYYYPKTGVNCIRRSSASSPRLLSRAVSFSVNIIQYSTTILVKCAQLLEFKLCFKFTGCFKILTQNMAEWNESLTTDN